MFLLCNLKQRVCGSNYYLGAIPTFVQLNKVLAYSRGHRIQCNKRLLLYYGTWDKLGHKLTFYPEN